MWLFCKVLQVEKTCSVEKSQVKNTCANMGEYITDAIEDSFYWFDCDKIHFITKPADYQWVLL